MQSFDKVNKPHQPAAAGGKRLQNAWDFFPKLCTAKSGRVKIAT
jgi:hypothetical protein